MNSSHPALVLGDIPRSHAARRGSATALTCDGRALSFAELDERGNRVAQALLATGVRPRARVAVLDKDSERSFELIFGIAKAGAVSLGINWRLTAREMRFILEDSDAQMLFVGPEFQTKASEAVAGLPRIPRVIALRGEHPTWPAFGAWRDAHEPVDPRVAVDPEDPAVQMYTSGTTGNPKGVQLAHRSFFAIVRSLEQHGDVWIGWSERDVVLHNIPAFHIGGLWWAITALAAGARLVVMEAFAGWQALELIQQERVTKACLVPAMLQLVLSEPGCKRADFSALDCIVYGGSPIPLALLEEAQRTFGCRFAQIYGLTETGNTAVCLRPEDHASPRKELLKAAGRPYPGVKLKIIDAQGSELSARAIGEICIHSPANMLCYWNDPAATARTLRDGWVHTGDAGFLDEEGYVYVCDRVKDMIISAGENIYPAEIESVLCAHPAVAEAAVIGIPHERWGEEVKAIVVLRPGEELRPRELIAFARGQIADFKLPRTVDFTASLPRTPSGKLKKAELRAPYWQGRERQVN